MKTILLILGSQSGTFAAGKYNEGLFEAAKELLSKKFNVFETKIEEGYEITDEIK